MTGVVFSLLLLLTVVRITEGGEKCGNDRCEPVMEKGVRTPQYCGMEGRCEKCGVFACRHLHSIPGPCQTFCSRVAYLTADVPTVLPSSTVPPPTGQGDDANYETNCGEHRLQTNVSAVVSAFLAVGLSISVVLNVIQLRYGSNCSSNNCSTPNVGDGNVQPQLFEICDKCRSISVETTDLKTPLFGGETTGSQSSLLAESHKSSCESLRHVKAQPENERNAKIAAAPRPYPLTL